MTKIPADLAAYLASSPNAGKGYKGEFNVNDAICCRCHGETDLAPAPSGSQQTHWVRCTNGHVTPGMPR